MTDICMILDIIYRHTYGHDEGDEHHTVDACVVRHLYQMYRRR
jgi:hypothetical protein